MDLMPPISHLTCSAKSWLGGLAILALRDHQLSYFTLDSWVNALLHG